MDDATQKNNIEEILNKIEETKSETELPVEEMKPEVESPAVEECITLLESSGCIEKAAEQGRKLIQESCARFKSPQIQELFISMIPENFR